MEHSRGSGDRRISRTQLTKLEVQVRPAEGGKGGAGEEIILSDGKRGKGAFTSWRSGDVTKRAFHERLHPDHDGNDSPREEGQGGEKIGDDCGKMGWYGITLHGLGTLMGKDERGRYALLAGGW